MTTTEKLLDSLHELRRDLVLNILLASPLLPARLRWRALRAYGLEVEKSHLMPRIFIGSGPLRIGRNSFVNYDCFLDNRAPISIGRDCSLAMRVVLATSSHDLGGPRRRAGATAWAPIVIEDGCWLGAGCTVLPGVTIGEGTVVAAGAIVTSDCQPHSLYAGVPARKVRDLQR